MATKSSRKDNRDTPAEDYEPIGLEASKGKN
jgi:hypothetical protein